MADIAYDLLANLEEADCTPGHPGVLAEKRHMADFMRQRGFTETEIGWAIGELPESALSGRG
jgi:hypothetical protein